MYFVMICDKWGEWEVSVHATYGEALEIYEKYYYAFHVEKIYISVEIVKKETK